MVAAQVPSARRLAPRAPQIPLTGAYVLRSAIRRVASAVVPTRTVATEAAPPVAQIPAPFLALRVATSAGA